MRATRTSTPSVIRVLATWKSHQYLDRVHMEAGLGCQSCHMPFPPKRDPSNQVCLACHEGSYYAMGKLTGDLDPNPHAGCREFACAACHGGHKPFVFFCTHCHAYMVYSGRFEPPTSVGAP